MNRLNQAVARRLLKERGEWPRRSPLRSAWIVSMDETVEAAFRGKTALSKYLGFSLEECDAWAPSLAVLRDWAASSDHDPEELAWFANFDHPNPPTSFAYQPALRRANAVLDAITAVIPHPSQFTLKQAA